jgi:outer membrane protein assembly factor BamA
LTSDQLALQSTYSGIGYVFADIKPEPRFLEESAQIDLVVNIKEGGR